MDRSGATHVSETNSGLLDLLTQRPLPARQKPDVDQWVSKCGTPALALAFGVFSFFSLEIFTRESAASRSCSYISMRCFASFIAAQKELVTTDSRSWQRGPNIKHHKVLERALVFSPAPPGPSTHAPGGSFFPTPPRGSSTSFLCFRHPVVRSNRKLVGDILIRGLWKLLPFGWCGNCFKQQGMDVLSVGGIHMYMIRR